MGKDKKEKKQLEVKQSNDLKLIIKVKEPKKRLRKQNETLSDALKENLEKLYKEDDKQIFWYPVTEEDVPGYSTIIKNPMDLSTIKQKLSTYIKLEDFWKDVDLMLNNCIIFNESSTIFHQEAKRIQKFSKQLKKKEEEKLTNSQKEYLRIIDKLIAKDKDGIFLEPVPDSVEGYYELIENPMDFTTLKEKISSIHTLQDFKENLELIFKNSMKFNEKDSIFYKEAENLLNYTNSLLKQDDLVIEKEKLYPLMEIIMEKLENEDTSMIFAEPVLGVPGYDLVIKSPMDFLTMKNKMKDEKYSTWQEYEDDLELCFNNAKTFNDKTTIYHKEAVKLQRTLQRLKKKIQLDLSQGKEVHEIFKKSTSKNQSVKKSLPFDEILNRLIQDLMKLDKKKLFYYPVNTRELNDYLDVIETPMDFITMKNKMKDNKYKDLNEFKKDFELICENAKKYNDSQSLYYKEAERLLSLGSELIQESFKIEIEKEEEHEEEEEEEDDETPKKKQMKKKKESQVHDPKPKKSSSLYTPLKFQISKIPSIVKKFSESMKELSDIEYKKIQNSDISILYEPKKEMNEERYISSLHSFTNAIGNMATGKVNIVLQKYGLLENNQLKDFANLISIELPNNNEVIKDIENAN